MRLWTVGDIARELGLAHGTVAMWGHPGRRPVPEPYATCNPQGMRLWTEEQYAGIIADYREEARHREVREADLARAEAALAALVAS